MGRMSEVWAQQQEHMDEQEALHQLTLEREEMVDEALKRLAYGMGGRREIEILARECGRDSPYK